MPAAPPFPLEVRLHPKFFRIVALVVLLLLPVMGSAWAAERTFDDILQALPSASYDAKAPLIGELADTGHPRAVPVLRALEAGELYVRKDDQRVFIVRKIDGGYALTDPLSGEAAGEAGRRDVKRIGINNTLRNVLAAQLAALSLAAPEASVRREAVAQMHGKLDETLAARLRARLDVEPDRGVRGMIREALALVDLQAADEPTRLAAVQTLRGSLTPEARVRLLALADDPEAGAALRTEAQQAVASIDRWRSFYRLVETVFFGLSAGSVLLLAAIGLAITFGVMGVINMAHGEFLMLGAYTAYVLQQLLPEQVGLAVVLAVPAAFAVTGLVGVGIERGLIRHLYGRPLETLLLTFGLSLILQQAVRTVFSPLNRSVATPEWMSGAWQINPALALTYNRLAIILFALVVFLALLALLRYTRLGLQVRAVSQDRQMAQALGVRSEWVDALTFGLGAGIAGIGGVALSQLTNVGPNLGQSYIIDSFLVVVFGGVGNLWGTMVAALTLGLANKFLEPAAGAVLAKILVLVFIILFIQRRPRGLFPQRGRAAEA